LSAARFTNKRSVAGAAGNFPKDSALSGLPGKTGRQSWVSQAKQIKRLCPCLVFFVKPPATAGNKPYVRRPFFLFLCGVWGKAPCLPKALDLRRAHAQLVLQNWPANPAAARSSPESPLAISGRRGRRAPEPVPPGRHFPGQFARTMRCITALPR